MDDASIEYMLDDNLELTKFSSGVVSILMSSLEVQKMERQDHEMAALRAEVDKLKRREVGWATELQDAATVTSQLTERMEVLESVLATKEEALRVAQVRRLVWLGHFSECCLLVHRVAFLGSCGSM